MRAMRTWFGPCLAAATLIGAAAPSSGAELSYPRTSGRVDVAAWVGPATGVRLDQVVYLSDESLFAVISTKGEGALRGAEVRGEALTSEVAARTGAVSVRMHVDLDCANGLVRAGATLGYASRDAQGPSVLLALADPAWRRPVRQGPLERAWGYVCVAQRGALQAPSARASSSSSPPPAGVVAQLASMPTEAGARAEIQDLGPRLSSPLSARIEAAQVQGRSVYRVIVAGFASPGAARAFCATARPRFGRACFIREPTHQAGERARR